MKKRSVYIVDDDEDIRDYYVDDFREKFEVFDFESGKLALAACDEMIPDCFIIDYRMPEMTGLDLIVQLRNQEIHRPCLMVTGAADKEMAVKSLSLGVYAIQEKPCNVQELMVLTDKAIAQHLSMQINEQLLEEFKGFISLVEQLDKYYFEKTVSLEEKLQSSVLENLSVDEKKAQMNLMKTERSVRKARKLIDGLFGDYDAIKKMVGI